MVVTLKVFRNSCEQNKNWKGMIYSLWGISGSIYKTAAHCNSISAEAIIDSFEMINNAFCKNNLIRVHAFSLVFETNTKIEDALPIVNAAMSYYASLYQIIVNVFPDDEGKITATFILNAISFHDKRSFHDNNQSYGLFVRYLTQTFKTQITLNTEDKVIFGAGGPTQNNYYQNFSGGKV